MVIQTSQVGMSSTYKKTAYEAASVSYTGWGESGITADFMNAVPTATDGAQTNEVKGTVQTKTEELFGMYAGSGQAAKQLSEPKEATMEKWSDENLTDAQKVELSSLKSLMEVFSDRLELTKVPVESLFQKLLERLRLRLEAILTGGGNSYRYAASKQASALVFGGAYGHGSDYVANAAALLSPQQPREQWVEETTISNFYAARETVEFQSAGKVTTADGREIEFDTSFTMTQSFVEYTNVEVDYKKVMMIDPLVINLGSGTAEVTDQKFTFDIDADGDEDNISLLGQMCGFLALDKNGDGEINDGSELFGTKTGDGFAELAVFDLDKNGWIDENDEVFNRLRIWKKDENGNDKLVGLGVQGIGAVYLGNVSTTYEMKGADMEGTEGMLQKTGVYLNEDGSAGTIQHLDFAV